METVIRRHKIDTIKAQAVLCRLICESAAKEFETGTLTEEQWSVLTNRRDHALTEGHALQMALDLLQRQQGAAGQHPGDFRFLPLRPIADAGNR